MRGEMTETSNFIKTEPDEHSSDPHHYIMSQSGYSMSNQFGNPNEGVDPSELSMQNGFMSYPFSSQQNLSSSFNFGNSGIDTDELLDLEINGHNGVQQNYLQDQQSSAGISMSHPGQMSQMYSYTPDGAPMHSPFMHSFNYDHFRSMGQPGQAPHLQGNGSHFDQSYLNAKARPSIQALDRASYDGRSPMTPKTPALGALTLGTPESGSFPTQPIRTGLQHRHQKTLSNQWDGTPGSAHSYVESPISSPGHPSHHAGISEILKSGKHASLPAKVDTHMPGSAQDLESQEAKRRRRRASHNLVERRRRDNINERIQDLSHLVPQHRLEDDKVRKQLVNNTAMSGTGATANAATSLLAGGNGRRATAGNITMGLPIEEKEKGPNKGDILNGAVGWMRDLMWALHVKLQQESELAELISRLGGTWPFEQTEEEKRMRTEILDALEKNDPSSFAYSRAPGSGLRVPKHTNIAGDSVSGNGTLSPQSLSPPFNSGGSSNGGGSGQAQYWNSSGHAGMSFKEEDEYAMEMN
ncbi:basic helix-loop-helix domain-containing protein [Aspergillus fijiensis CBS 313.89]|uniref:Putative HLH transcription factor n=1 Tax=Aspergillus fijiensis CBS 313.89 TaxID=1448319 RepID=A0A8G1W6J4_9EURO|nr:putative HLH transcription factor [Aspergillus fijiensis CBS 313.89]RAK82354.1 putative HLH transcription factor [Aspergillus fijiensis CBS 313.89]